MKQSRFISSGVLFAVLIAAQFSYGNPICSHAHAGAATSFAKRSSNFFYSYEINLKALRVDQSAKINTLLAKISKAIPLELGLIDAIEPISTDFYLLKDSERAQMSMLKAQFAFAHSQQFRSLSHEDVAHAVESLAHILPSELLIQEIKAHLYMILDAHHLVADPRLQSDIEALTEEMHTASLLRAKASALKFIQSEMPEIQSLMDYQTALFSLPAQIRSHLPVTDSQMQTLIQYSRDYQNVEIKNLGTFTSAQDQVLKSLEGFLSRTSPFQESPPSYRNAIGAKLEQMGTLEDTALAVAIAANETGQSSWELQKLVRRYQALNLVRSLLGGAELMMNTPFSKPN